tara:strand:+ start:72 stop:269 length:198 start_codon:yes stop_codon:yes gene_type:complete
MFKFICKKCKNIKEISKAVLEIVDGKVRTKKTECSCGEWMIEVEKDMERKGFPSLIRTEPTLNKK